MAWSYELRGSENRLVELRRGFATKKEAETAAENATRMIRGSNFIPDKEDLTTVTKDEAEE